MAELIMDLFDSPEKLKKFGENGREYFVNRMKTNVIADEIIEL